MSTRKLVVGSLLTCVIVAAGAVLVVRHTQRPQTIADDAAEYVMKPGTTYAGLARTTINRHNMRAVQADAYPVLLVGDSVLVGWARIDQDDIAALLLTQRLGVPVGNASANSWGPPNQLGYLRDRGTFSARVVVVVWSGWDASDVPGHDREADGPIHEQALHAARDLLELAKASGATPVVAMHLTTDELRDGPGPGHDALCRVAEDAGARLVHLRLPPDCYKDVIHPNVAGHRLIADQLEPVIRAALGE